MKVALVTGAAQGVGFATARLLAEKGYHVVMTDVQPLDAQVEALVALGGSVSALSGDISSEEFVVELAAKFFEAQLQKPAGSEARAYLAKRGFGERTQAEFRIGFGFDACRRLHLVQVSKERRAVWHRVMSGGGHGHSLPQPVAA
jgi:NAD(P)-dependent dehydrogenase (short-subunit alcohol dehydrogenase family)